MRKRNCRVEIYFTGDELDLLTKKSRKSGLSREGFCRRILNGAEVKEAPPADIPMLIQEVRRVGSSLDRLLKLTGSAGLLDTSQLHAALKDNRNMEKLITETYTTRTD